MSKQLDATDKTPITLENGPIGNPERTQTDIVFCVLFVFTLIGMIAVGAYAIKVGDPSKLNHPYDPDHRACGQDAAVKDFPYIYYATLESKYLYRTVCVKSCPLTDTDTLLCAPNSVVISCSEVDSTTDPSKNVEIYASQPNDEKKMCVPKDKDDFSEVSDTATNDVGNSKYVILGCVFLALLLSTSYLFIFLLEKQTAITVWTFIIGYLSCLLAFGFIFLYGYYQLKKKQDPATAAGMNQDIQKESMDPRIMLWASYFFFGIAVIYLIYIFCIRNRIRLAISVLKAASEYLIDNPSSVLVPPIFFVVMLLITIFWGFSQFFLYTVGQPSTKPHSLPYDLEPNMNQQILSGFQVFGYTWVMSFLIGASEFILIGAACIWYFKQGTNFVSQSTKRFFKFHTGTVAFGSLILTIMSFIRKMAENSRKSSNNLATQFLVMCIDCCLQCVRLINKNAYVMTNMNGKSFCDAAIDALDVMKRNVGNYAATLGIGQLIIGVGRLLIAAADALICYLILKLLISKGSIDVVYPSIPAIIVFIIALIIGIIIDALLVLVCLDLEIQSHHYGVDQPKHCPDVLFFIFNITQSLKEFFNENQQLVPKE